MSGLPISRETEEIKIVQERSDLGPVGLEKSAINEVSRCIIMLKS
jgi:hypothetical protein